MVVNVEQHAEPPITTESSGKSVVTEFSDKTNIGESNHKMEIDGNFSDSSESGTTISTNTECELNMSCYESVLENFQTNWDPMGID